MTVKNFTNISNSLHHVAKVVAQRSMSTAMNELRSVRNIYKTDIGVSVDGTWQRRGFTSLNGVLVVISIDSGKIVDMSRCQDIVVNVQFIPDVFKTSQRN